MTETPSTSPSLEYEIQEDALLVWIDEEVASRDAILDAAFAQIDRCYVYVGGPDEGRLPLRLEARGEASEAQLEELAQHFAEVLAHRITATRIAHGAGQIRDFYTARALFGAGSVATVDELLAELDDEELDDPLEVEVPWAKPPETAEASPEAAASPEEPAAEERGSD